MCGWGKLYSNIRNWPGVLTLTLNKRLTMTASFIFLLILTVGTAMAVMLLRNLVHCALALAVTFAGLAALYLQLNAQFAGLAQILVYVGAVANLIVFAIL